MADEYVESGYVEDYVEGDTAAFEAVIDTAFDFKNNAVGIVHFVSSGNLSEAEIVSDIRNKLDGRLGLLFAPEMGAIMLISENGIQKFMGGGIGDMNVQIKAQDGTIIATPEVVRDGTTFTYTVPENMSDTAYDVSIHVSVCDGC